MQPVWLVAFHDAYRSSHALILLSNPGPYPDSGFQEGVDLTASSPAKFKPSVLCQKGFTPHHQRNSSMPS